MRLELGEITDSEFAEIERDVLARDPRDQGRAARARFTMSPGDKITGVEVERSRMTTRLASPA